MEDSEDSEDSEDREDRRLSGAWWILRLTYGLVPIVAGIDKFTNLLTDWTHYLNPMAARLLPVSPGTFMHLAGIIEIGAGILILTRFTRLAAYIVSAWLVLIALNLFSAGQYLDVGVRDAVMAVGAFTLAKLTEARELATEAHGQKVASRLEPTLGTAR